MPTLSRKRSSVETPKELIKTRTTGGRESKSFACTDIGGRIERTLEQVLNWQQHRRNRRCSAAAVKADRVFDAGPADAPLVSALEPCLRFEEVVE